MTRALTNQVAIITGGSSGIGAATAVACARAGIDVLLNGRRPDRLAAVADRVRQAGRRAELVVGDVIEPGLNARLLDVAQERFGRFDVVFANAGYGFKRATHETEPAELRAIFEVNFFAGVELLRDAARRLIAARRPGHLLMCSSAVAKFTLHNFAAYSATKAAQNHVCRAMRMELRPHRIEVASVHPVTTQTEFLERVAKYSGQSLDGRSPFRPPASWFVQPPERVARAVVRCLHHPRPEVWTSFPTRLAAGLMTIFPRLMDALGRR